MSKKGNTLQAIDDLNQALACEAMSNDEHVQILVRRGSVKYAGGYKDQAQIDFSAAWELNPTDPNLQSELWRCAAKLKVDINDQSGALNALDEAIKCTPTQGLDMCLLERGRVLVRLDQLDDAILDFSNGIKIASNEETKALLYLARGDTHFKRDDLTPARQDWEKASECKFANELLRAEINGRFVRNGF
jgi:tetratricopeptide (TPR) repeat protein